MDTDFLINLRKAFGLSQGKMGEYFFGVSREYLCTAEKGRRSLTLNFLLKLQERFKNMSTALILLSFSKIPDEFTVEEAEAFTVLRAIARGKMIAYFDFERVKLRDPGALEEEYTNRGWIIGEV